MDLERIAQKSVDHFHKLGGADCYTSYRVWHSYALVVLLATNRTPDNRYKDNELLERFMVVKGLSDMFALRNDHVHEIKKMIEGKEFEMSEIREFKERISGYFEYKILSKRQVDAGKKHEIIQNLKDWTLFCWLMNAK